MTEDDNTVDLGMMPTDILPVDSDPPTFFMAEMEKGSGRVRPSDEGVKQVEEAIERYAQELSEHTSMTLEEARDQLGLK